MFVAQYTKWKVATASLDGLGDAEKQLVKDQQQVWKALGIVEDANKAGGVTLPSKLPDINAVPAGSKTKILDQMDIETKTSLIRENEGADILAQKGFDIEQNPIVSGTTRNPDYRIEGEIFDCYSPYNNNKPVRGIWKEVSDKLTKGQTERVFLNLKYWEGDIANLQKQFADYPIIGLKEIMLVDKNNTIQYLKL